MGNMRFKVGDRVLIKSIDWYNENKDENGNIVFSSIVSRFSWCENVRTVFTKDMTRFCGKVVTIETVWSLNYSIVEGTHKEYFTDEMIEGLVEEESTNYSKVIDNDVSNPIIAKTSSATIDTDKGFYSYSDSDDNLEMEWNLPQGYQFVDENGNVITATKIVLEKKINKEMAENNIKVDMGEVSDGYHTFNELYEYRMLYNAALFNEFAKQELYDVHKSRKHSDGEYPFGDANWFIVMAELPTGQISNHYEMKDWDKFQIPEKPLANKWDEHTPRDVADRLTSFTNPKKKYPKTYEECCDIMEDVADCSLSCFACGLLNNLQKLLLCRDAYWKLAGEEMGLDGPWEPDWEENSEKSIITKFRNAVAKFNTKEQYTFAFPTEEMRDAFYENFKEEIEICKELL